MLGKTIPEPQKKTGRVFVCSAGYSHEFRRLMRIYPLAKGKSPPRWSVSRVRLQRNPQDNREESWQLCGDRSPGNHEQINKCFEIIGHIERPERGNLIQPLCCPSIEAANAKRISLCIIEPRFVPVLSFEDNPDSPDHPQSSMFDLFDDGITENPEGARRFTYQPYLEFVDEAGRHRLQLRDWGGYEFMRKHGDDRRHELTDAWRLRDRPCLLIGNMNHQRTVWLVISVLLPIRQMAFDLEASALLANAGE
jgi:hypothetical protein